MNGHAVPFSHFPSNNQNNVGVVRPYLNRRPLRLKNMQYWLDFVRFSTDEVEIYALLPEEEDDEAVFATAVVEEDGV